MNRLLTGQEPRAAGHGRLRRWSGITDWTAFTTPIWQAALTGVVFVAVGLIGFHAPAPRGMKIDIAGPPARTALLERVLDKAAPGGFTAARLRRPATGLHDVRHGRAYALVDLRPRARLYYAGANGPTATAVLTTLIPAIAARLAIRLRPVDLVPLRHDDTAALPLFYLTFGVILASYLFAVSASVASGGLPARAHWLAALTLAVALGVAATSLGRFATQTLSTSATIPCVALLALASLATSSGSFLLITSSRVAGSVIASLIFVVLGAASGGVVPAALQPAWLAALRPVLPMGAAFTGIHDVTYFHGTGALLEALVLAGWAMVPVLAYETTQRVRRARSPEHFAATA